MAVSCGEGMQAVPVDLCISSQLCRAMNTAEIVISRNAGYHERAEQVLQELEEEKAVLLESARKQYAGENGTLPYLIDERLVETSFGPWEGLICKAEGYNVPLEDFSLYWREPENPIIPEGVERLTNVAERLTSVLEDLAAAKCLQDKTVLLVVHGCVMRSVMYICGGRQGFTGKVPLNCEIIVCEPEGPDGLKELERKIYYDSAMIHDNYATMKQE